MMERSKSITTGGNTSRRNSPAPARAAPNVIDPVRVIRQSIGVLFVTGLLGLVMGVGVFLVWNMYAPRYDGFVLFELNAELSSSNETTARENRNEDTVQRIAQTEALKSISEEILERVLRQKDIQKTRWAQQFFDESGNFVTDRAYIALDETISAGHVRDTQFFRIKWSSKNAADVPVVLNAVADTYLEQRIAARAGILNNVRSVFGTQKEILEDNIVLSQQEIDEFIKTHDITTLDQGSTALTEDLADTTLELNRIKYQLSLASSRKKQVESKLLGQLEPSQDDIQLAEMDPNVLRSEGMIQELRTELAHAREKFSGEHKHLKTVQARLNASILTKNDKIDEVVQRNLSSDLKATDDQIESMASLETSLQDEIDSMSIRLEEFTSYYNDLQQKQVVLDRLQLRLEGLEQTQLEIQAMKDRDDAEKVVLAQKASKPRQKAWPKWYVIIPGTAFAAFGLVLAIVFLREFTDKRVRYASDVLSLPGASLLGMVPDLTDEPTEAARVEMIVRDHPASILAESYRQCYSSLLRSVTDESIQSIMVVGGLPESGATSVTTNLAIIAIASGRSVAVIDANFRRPRVAELMGLDTNAAGLGEILAGVSTLEDAITETRDGIKVLTAGSSPYMVFERLNTEMLSNVIEQLAEQVDMILIDAPPLVVAGEAMAISSRVDATVLVTRAYKEQKGLLARLIHQLSSQTSTFLGVILNRPRITAGGYYQENFRAMANYSNQDKKTATDKK